MYLKIRPPSGIRAFLLLTLVLALFFAFAVGCNKDSNTTNSPEHANSNGTLVTAPLTTNISAPTSTSSATTKQSGLSPTEVVRSYYGAGISNDIAGIKRLLSRASLQTMEEIAKRQGKTLDQLFSEAAKMDAQKPRPTFGNEKISGNTATVDIKTPGQPVLTMPLVKEDGEWKLAFGQPKSNAIKR